MSASTAPSPPLFSGIKYYIIGGISNEAKKLLDDNGASVESYLSDEISVAICNDPKQDEFLSAREVFALPVVTERWIFTSRYCCLRLPHEAFRPDAEQLFRGVVALVQGLSVRDANLIWAMLVFHGGECLLDARPSMTHVITSTTKMDMFPALKQNEHIKIVTPDWVLDSVRNKQLLDVVRYDPALVLEREPQVVIMSSQIAPPATVAAVLPASKSAAPPKPRVRPPRQRNPTPRAPKKPKVQQLQQPMQQAMPQQMPQQPLHYGQMPQLSQMVPGTSQGPTYVLASPGGMSENPKAALARLVNHRLMGLNGRPEAMLTLTVHGHPEARTDEQMVSALPGMDAGEAKEEKLYYGHDMTDKVPPPEGCLLGCVFYITDLQKSLDTVTFKRINDAIEKFGGKVDHAYSNRVTHILCENTESDLVRLALTDKKRIVTVHWLDDVLLQRQMRPPWHPLHFPLPFGEKRPCIRYLVAVSNFSEKEREQCKLMVRAIGAKYTSYFTAKHSLLICKRPEGLKYQKAVEWKVPVVSGQWLSDLVLGKLDALKLSQLDKYYNFPAEQFQLDELFLEKLLVGWRTPVKVSKEAWKKFRPIPEMVKIFPPNKRARESPPSAESRKRPRIETGSEPWQRPSSPVPYILFTGLTASELQQLSMIVAKLGGSIADSPKNATHLVTKRLYRTEKFLQTLSYCSYILNVDWLLQSEQAARFLDPAPFHLRDEANEKHYRCSLADTLVRSKKNGPLFKGLVLYLSPSIKPSFAILRSIVFSAGGQVTRILPSIATLSKTVQGRCPFVVISCECDLALLIELQKRKIPIHGSEFILSGVLRQEIDWEGYRLS